MTTVKQLRFGAKVDNYGPAAITRGLAEPARRAEEAGFDSVWTSDHTVMPVVTRSRYPFSADGSINWDPTDPWVDAIVALAVMATATERVEIGTGVLLAALRQPVVLAKQIASVDVLSGGRVVLGVGAGWLREEFDALGVPFESRGERLDEWISVLRACWTGRLEPRPGPHYALADPVLTHPLPARAVPVIVGGMSAAALRRAAAADGWFPLPKAGEDTVAVVERGLATIRTHAAVLGRELVPRVVLNAAAPQTIAPLLPRLAAAGVTDVLVDVDFTSPDGPERTRALLTG